jgi:hypothetical protein
VAWAQQGHLGKVLWALGTCYKRRPSIGKVTREQPLPAGLDYDLWCGPAPKKPLHRKNLHYDWHWVWDTGNGDIGNQGPHQMDIARWFLGEDALSPGVLAIGGRLGYIDDGETPNTMVVRHDYPRAPLYFEVRGLPDKAGASAMSTYRGIQVGVLVQYEDGEIRVPNYTAAAAFGRDGKMLQRWGAFSAPKNGPDPGKPDNRGQVSHHTNWIQAIRSRKPSDLHCESLEGHLSTSLCHTANISYRLGAQADPGVIRDKVKGSKEAADALERMIEHLRTNGVNVAEDKLVLGEHLRMDPKTERFLDNEEANKLLTQVYREPYVVPPQNA